LNNSNYSEWSIQMEAVLICGGLWSLVNITIDKTGKDEAIWEMLHWVHQAAGFATSLALCRKFLTAKKEDTQSMQTWIGVIQSLAFWMEEARIEVADQDKILALTMGLPNTYNAVIINFDLTPANLLTLDHIITRLLNEETRQVSQAPVTNDHC
ncbi:hypothetical protein L208DRAFT_1302220, partial [Tricholoma matsutake]